MNCTCLLGVFWEGWDIIFGMHVLWVVLGVSCKIENQNYFYNYNLYESQHEVFCRVGELLRSFWAESTSVSF